MINGENNCQISLSYEEWVLAMMHRRSDRCADWINAALKTLHQTRAVHHLRTLKIKGKTVSVIFEEKQAKMWVHRRGKKSVGLSILCGDLSRVARSKATVKLHVCVF